MLSAIQAELLQSGWSTVAWGEGDLCRYVAAVFRHSKVSYSVLLTGLLYLLRFRHHMAGRLAVAGCAIVRALEQSQGGGLLLSIFVSALLLSNKFLHDRHSSNENWAGFSGLGVRDVNRGEILFLTVVDHQINIDPVAFHKWTGILFQPGNLAQYQRPPPDNQVPSVVPDGASQPYYCYEAAGLAGRRRGGQIFMGYQPG